MVKEANDRAEHGGTDRALGRREVTWTGADPGLAEQLLITAVTIIVGPALPDWFAMAVAVTAWRAAWTPVKQGCRVVPGLDLTMSYDITCNISAACARVRRRPRGGGRVLHPSYNSGLQAIRSEFSFFRV